MPSFSLIIGYRESCPDRKRNLQVLLDEYKVQPPSEIVVVEQDTEYKFSGPARHVRLWNPGLYNRSWGFNVGAREALNDLLIFSDCDLLLHFHDLLSSVETCQRYDAINPKCVVYDVEEGVEDPFSYQEHKRDCINFSGGIVVMTREAFMLINGWNEGFRGWGGEDDVMTYKITSFLSHKGMPFETWHLFHQDRIRKQPNEEPYYKRNFELFDYYRKLYKNDRPKFKEVCLAETSFGDPEKYRSET